VKRWIRLAHLVLGLASGLVVVVIGTTGCLLAFEKEIEDFTQPYRFAPAARDPLPPSALIEAARASVPGLTPSAVHHYAPGRAATVEFYRYADGKDEYWTEVYLDPANGRVLRVVDHLKEFDFFAFVLDGHTHLWLPREVGRFLVGSATLAFVLLMLSGIVLWWPRNAAARAQRLKVKWNTGWKRRRYDLHVVLGFYGSFIAIFIAVTGLTWSFEWFSNAVYRVASGGKAPVAWSEALSDTTRRAEAPPLAAALDSSWRMARARTSALTIGTRVPRTPDEAIPVFATPDPEVYFRTDHFYFDRNTLEDIPARHAWGLYADAGRADRLQRLYYDIHIGAILGIPGKILVFLASLIAASLPVTGFLMWRSRNKKKKPKQSLERNSP
jgi:uncharacterized iron-regulated membrane protein